MTANRYRKLRAALCDSIAMAATMREHNDANVLTSARISPRGKTRSEILGI